MTILRALKVGLAAGLVAGVVLGAYILLVMGPLIDEAEAFEGEENPVSLELRRATAFGGAVLIGVLIGIPLALVFPLAESLLPWRSVVWKALVLGLLAYLIFSLLPILNVPTNPPGVETNLSVEEREFWYVGTMISALGGVLAGFGLYYILTPRTKSATARKFLLGGSLLVVATLWTLPFLLRPRIERISGVIPSGLIETFYYLTVLEWAVFWVVLSTALALLWPRFRAAPASESFRSPG